MENNKLTKGSLILNWIFGLIAMIVLVFVVRYFYVRLSNTYTDDARIRQQLVPVNARVGGYLKAIRFKEFRFVHKGDTLVTIDPTDYLIQKNQAKAGLDNAIASKEVLESTVNTLENAEAIANANLKESEARLWNAKQNYLRFKQLVSENSATQQQFDQMKSNYESLQARYESMLKSTKGADLSTIEAKKRLKAAEARIEEAKANLEMAQQNLDYTIILAPCDGLTGRKEIIPGQLVQRGQQLMQLVDDHSKWVSANFLEKDANAIQPGKKVEITVDAFPDQKFQGQIESVAGATGAAFALIPTDNSTGNFVKVQQRIPVRIQFAKSVDQKYIKAFRAGMNVEIYVD